MDQAETAVRTRVFSVVGSPNVLGSFFVLMIPITLSQALAAGSKAEKIFYLACLAPMLASLIFTYSRGAWIAFAVGLIIYGLLYNWRILIGLVFGAFAGLMAVPGISSRINYLLSPEYLMSSSKGGRIERWTKAIEVWQAHPLVGEGFGRFGGAVADRNIPGSIYVDNFYLKTLAESGIIGLLALILLFFAGLRCSLNSFNRLTDPYFRCLAAGIIAGLCGVLVHNSVENIFEVPMMASYFWLLLGTVAALPYMQKHSHTK